MTIVFFSLLSNLIAPPKITLFNYLYSAGNKFFSFYFSLYQFMIRINCPKSDSFLKSLNWKKKNSAEKKYNENFRFLNL